MLPASKPTTARPSRYGAQFIWLYSCRRFAPPRFVTKYRMPEKIEPIRYVTVSDASGSTLSGKDFAQM